MTVDSTMFEIKTYTKLRGGDLEAGLEIKLIMCLQLNDIYLIF